MNKKQIAFNTHLIPVFVLFVVFLSLSANCAIGDEIALCVGFAMFALLTMFVFAISPLYFVFSDESVEIVYHFKQREQIQWGDIRSISFEGSWFHSLSGPPHYVIAHPQKQKRWFFVEGEIPKTRKTQKLIMKYYKGTIKF